MWGEDDGDLGCGKVGWVETEMEGGGVGVERCLGDRIAGIDDESDMRIKPWMPGFLFEQLGGLVVPVIEKGEMRG